jgi:hypothetical protein
MAVTSESASPTTGVQPYDLPYYGNDGTCEQ